MKYQVMLTDGRTFSDSCVRAVEWLPGCMEIVPDGGVPEIKGTCETIRNDRITQAQAISAVEHYGTGRQ